jgi:hypothetical protein
MTQKEWEQPAPDRSRLFARLSWGAVAAAIVLYLIHYLGGRSLWLDEAMIALNIQYLSLDELRGKLNYDQVAPVGWIYLERALYALTGNFEYALRLPSLVAGIGAVTLFRQVSFKALPPLGAFCATLIFAFSGVMVRFASEVKPYMVDVALSVAALWFAVNILKTGRLSSWTALLFGLTGLVTVLMSFSAVYVLAATGGAVFLKFALERRWKPLLTIGVMAASWLALFGAVLAVIYLPNLQGTELAEGGASRFFTRTAYAPFPPVSGAEIVWYLDWAERFIGFLFGREAWFPIAALIGLGVVGYLRRDWPLVLMGVGPVIIMLMASSFKILPAYERLTLFSAPGLMLMAGAGAAYVARLSKGANIGALVLTGLVVAGSGGYLIGNLFKQSPPFAQHDIAPVLAELKENLKPGETVFVANMALPAWVAYSEAYGLKHVPWIEGQLPNVSWECTIKDMVSQTGAGRYWVVYVYNESFGEPDPGHLNPIVGEKGLVARYDVKVHAAQAMLVAVDLEPRIGGPLPPAPPSLCSSDGTDGRFLIPPRIRDRAKLH